MDKILLTTIDEVPGARVIRVIGLVRGNSVRARDLGHDLLANLKNLVGGEIVEAREEALDRLAAQAAANGANAVVGLRFASAEVMAGAAELLAYGTAVVLEEIQARA